MAQEISEVDLNKLRRAEQSADKFSQRLCETLDFALVWKEFRASKVSSFIHYFIANESSLKSQKNIDETLVERGYIALLNYVYLSNLYELSVNKIGSNLSEEEFIPKEIREAEIANKYIKTNGAEPQNLKELEEYIVEADNLANMYRKYVSADACKSPIYKENVQYLSEFDKQDEEKYRIVKGENFGLGKSIKVYKVTRGGFHYGLIEEMGVMKVVGMGFGN